MEESHATIVVKETDVGPAPGEDVNVRRVPPPPARGAGILTRLIISIVLIVLAIPIVVLGLACMVVLLPLMIAMRILRSRPPTAS